MSQSSHHTDVPWCTVGGITILYHTQISMNTSVTYDERTVFGSHGMYAVWTGTAPRTFSVSATLVGANGREVQFNLGQVAAAYKWTQGNPPRCKKLKVPSGASKIFNTRVRIESMDASIPEAVHLFGGAPIQIEFSLNLKECKAI